MIKFLMMKCPNFIRKHCLSCDLLAHDYFSSIKIKEQTLIHLFPKHIDKIKPSVICEKADGTRNKAKLAVILLNQQIEFGFYDRHQQFKQLENCPLHAKAINHILPILKKLLREHRIIPYDIFKKCGELKYVLITYSETTNQLLVRFVLRSEILIANLEKLTIALLTIHPAIKVVTANIQAVHQAILEGEKEIVLTQEDAISHQFDNYFLYQGPRSFFQTNSQIALKLYQAFQAEIKHLSITSFLDLYCGVGAFSFFAAKYVKQVTGVEISEAAIFYANKACVDNHADIDFIAMDAEKYLISQQVGSFDAMMVNPPRRGLNQTIITELLRLAPNYLFYSSCNAETLQRDVLWLEDDYEMKSLQLFDMFPFTSHFETLAVMSRKQVF